MTSDWNEIPFGEFATLQRGADLPIQHRRSGEYPVLASNGVVGFHEVPFTSGPGVVTGRSGTIGKPTFIDASYWPLNTVLWVSDFHDNNPRFVYYFFHFFDFRAYATGTSVPTLNRNFVHSVLIKVPPTSEQQKIAAVLWKVQCAIVVEEKLIETARELKQSAMSQLFMRGVRGESQKETDIGPMPQSWEVKRICDVAVVKGGKRLPKGRALVDDNTGFPYVRVTDMRDNSVDVTNLKFVPKDVHPAISRYTISSKDVYISIAGTIGSVGIIPEELEGANLTENAARLVLTDPGIDERFLMRALDSPSAQQQFRSLTAKNAQPKLALTRIEQALIPKPSNIDEQKEIARSLDIIQKKISVHERKRATLQDLFETLLHQLMTGQIRLDKLDIDTSEMEATN